MNLSNIYFLYFFLYFNLVSCDLSNQNIHEKQNNSFKVKDIDGNIYETVVIKNQIWFKENLKTTRFNNGDKIQIIIDSNRWANTNQPAYSYFNNDTLNKSIFGNLYNWYVVNDLRGVCPQGWRVPEDSDWTTLSINFGGPQNSGSELKSELNYWENNQKNSNISGFSALPSGHRNENGLYERMHSYCYFWSKNEYQGDACVEGFSCAHECSLQDETSYFLQDWGFKQRGMAIRCIKEKD
jgi:uncharacterized protein (TIGR02145 family)